MVADSHRPVTTFRHVVPWPSLPLALGAALLWGLVEFCALCRARLRRTV